MRFWIYILKVLLTEGKKKKKVKATTQNSERSEREAHLRAKLRPR